MFSIERRSPPPCTYKNKILYLLRLYANIKVHSNNIVIRKREMDFMFKIFILFAWLSTTHKVHSHKVNKPNQF